MDKLYKKLMFGNKRAAIKRYRAAGKMFGQTFNPSGVSIPERDWTKETARLKVIQREGRARRQRAGTLKPGEQSTLF